MFRVIPDVRGFREHVLLRDGEGLLLRLATADDRGAVERLLGRVSPASLRMRFMGAVAHVPRGFLDDLCGGDPRDRACLLAVAGEDRVVGLGNYVSLGVRHTAEVAFLVEDAYQGRGISTLLLERLAGIAAGVGLVGFEAEVLFENQAMMGVFRDSGFEVRQGLEGGSVHVEFPLAGAAAVRERAELRERIATAASLERLLRPRVVAVVGASARSGSVGGLIFQHVLRNGFAGTVYPVNARASSVHGVRAYASVGVLPETADMVVIAVPAERVLDVAEDALEAGARALVVVTSGFAEAGQEGAERQHRLVEMVRSAGARLVGPNCLGLLNTDPRVRLDASLAPELPPVGRVGFFSHSAALGIVIIQHAAERGLGFSTFVSAGNRADVSGNDLLEYWEEYPATDVAMLYLEAFGNARRFARVARRIGRRKPVLCVKSARSRAGRTAASAHIAARPLEDVDVDVLFAQAGVIRLDTLEELFELALLLSSQPLPAGDRVAVIGNSGGVVTLTADACEAHGLKVGDVGLVDLGALSGPEDYRVAVERALRDDAVDAALVIFLCVGDCDPDTVGRGIRRGVVAASRATGRVKPVLLCLMGTSGAVRLAQAPASDRAATFPSYRFPESAARALARAASYAAWRRRPAGRLVLRDDVDSSRARRVLEEHVTDGVAWLPEQAAGELLACYGIRTGGPAAGAGSAGLEIRPHPDFGPLVVLEHAGRRGARITPLTDADAQELLAMAGAQEMDAGEVLERLSQMLEELPWIDELHALVAPVDAGVALSGLRVRARRPA